MAQPFERSKQTNGRLGRLLRGRGSDAFGTIEELLAQAPRVRDVGQDVVWGVCAARGVDLRQRYGAQRKGLYRRYVEHCFADKALSPEETVDLLHLRSMLHLGPEEVAQVHDVVAKAVYGQAVDEVLADLRIDPDEESFLRRLREELQLPEAEAARLLADAEHRARERARGEAISRDPDFVRNRTPAGEFTGRSTTTFDAAVADALGKAVRAVPKLHWFEVVETAGYVEGAGVKGWHVVIRAGISQEDLRSIE